MIFRVGEERWFYIKVPKSEVKKLIRVKTNQKTVGSAESILGWRPKNRD